MDELEQQSWRGKHIIVKRDVWGVKCQAMEGDRSLLFVPVKVDPNTMYRLHLDLRRESGNGKLFCNFYANRSFDFLQTSLTCETGEWGTFDIQVKTGNFPANLPIVLRLWRTPGGTGSLLVRRIAFEKLLDGTIAEEPKLIMLSTHGRLVATQPVESLPEPEPHPRGGRPHQTATLAHRPIFPALPDGTHHSCFEIQPTRVLVASEIGDETVTCDAFIANGFGCEGIALTGDVQRLPALIGSKKMNWVHFHIGRKTVLTPQIVDQIRDAVSGVTITMWMEPGWPIFNSKLLEVLRCADVAFMETELELTTYRGAGCFNAELWDPGSVAIVPDVNGVGHDVILLSDGNLEEHGELIRVCTQRFGDRFMAVGTTNPSERQKTLCGAKVVIFSDSWCSRTLFGLLAAKLPVVARRSISTIEWCEDELDLRLFETPEDGVRMVEQLLDNLDAAKIMGERGATTAALHSMVGRVRELTIRLGCFEAVVPALPKDRTSYTSKRMLCAMRMAPWELMARGGDQDVDFMAASFTECRDLAAKIVRFDPDLLHIHLETENDALPWRDLLLDLRRRLPGMLTTVFHPGGSVDGRVLDLRFSVDHILVGDAGSAEQYHALSLKGVQTWKPTAMPFENPEVFRDDMLAFARGMADRRTAFLRSAEGQPVDLTVFIGTCNRFDPLRKAVETALASAHQRSVEIIINDAGSTDGTQEWLRNVSVSNRRIIPIFSSKRTSFTQAFNESLQIAKGKYICWLSDDIVSEAHALFDMCAIMDSVTPMDMGGFCVRNSWGHEYTVRYGDGFHWPTVGCMYTETLRKLNGINMDYPYYSQDTDLDMRVYRLGGRIIAAHRCRLLHNCSNDELRRSNSNNHINAMGDVKFTLAAWRLSETSRFPYPTVLLMPATGCSKDDILAVARQVRSQYSNSHIFVAGETSENLDVRGPNSFLRKIPTTNLRTPLLFSLVIRIESGKGILVRPADRADMPFVRQRLLGNP
jgi:GT2 family glycosyltransferase